MEKELNVPEEEKEFYERVNSIKTREEVSLLSDEDLKKLTSTLALNDDEGRQIVFHNEDEACVYAAMLQRNIPEIRFVKVHKCFTIYFGWFWLIEPMKTVKSDEEGFEYNSSDDFVYPADVQLFAIAELCKREREAENANLKNIVIPK